MKNYLIILLFFFANVSYGQNIDDLSKKELKELALKYKRNIDSLNLVNKQLGNNLSEKERQLIELKSILEVTETRLNKMEFESSSCKLTQDSLKKDLLSKELEVSKLQDSIVKSGAKSAKIPVLTCSYKEEKIPDCDYPVRIKTCIFGNYKNVKSANPDFKGNYDFSYEVYKKVKDKYVLIKNSDLFNAQKMELLDKINGQVKINFDEFLSTNTSNDCFDNAAAPYVPFEDMFVHFTNDGIEFHVKFNVTFGCFSDQGTVIFYAWKDIIPYLN